MAPELARCPADCVAYTPAGKHACSSLESVAQSQRLQQPRAQHCPRTGAQQIPALPVCPHRATLMIARSSLTTPAPPPCAPCLAGDIWSLGVVLFVLLSGSHVPFGNRGLCWTSIPNMPGPQESVDKLQKWLEVRPGARLEGTCVHRSAGLALDSAAPWWKCRMWRHGGAAGPSPCPLFNFPICLPLPLPPSNSPATALTSPSAGAPGLQGGSHQPAAGQPGEGQGTAGCRAGEHCMSCCLWPSAPHARCSGVRAYMPCALASPARAFVVTVPLLMPAYIAPTSHASLGCRQTEHLYSPLLLAPHRRCGWWEWMIAPVTC